MDTVNVDAYLPDVPSLCLSLQRMLGNLLSSERSAYKSLTITLQESILSGQFALIVTNWQWVGLDLP